MTSKIEKYLLPIAEKLATNKYLVALRVAFSSIMPIIIAGSIFGIFNWVVMDPNGVLMGKPGLGIGLSVTGLTGEAYMQTSFVATLLHLKYYFSIVVNATFGVLALYLCVSLSMEVGKIHGVEPRFAGFVGLASVLIVSPQTIKHVIDGVETTIPGAFRISYFGSSSLISVIIMSYLMVYIYAKFSKVNALKIKMPETVPTMVTASFENLIPITLTIAVASFIAGTLNWMGLPNFNQLIYNIIQAPLSGFSQGLGFGLLYEFLVQLIWWFGIHGGDVMSPISTAVYTPATLSNLEGVTQFIFTNGFFSAAHIHNVSIIIAIFMVSKKDEWKSVAKVGTPAALFNIGEPLMFGLPIMLNPLLIIPFILAPMINSVIGYILISLKIVPVFRYMVPWTVPPVLYGLIATGSIMGALLQVIYLVVDVFLFIPFISANNKLELKDND